MNGPRRPLVVTGQPELLDDLLGVAAAVGVAVDVAVDPGGCRPQWTSAPLVLVGADVATASVEVPVHPRAGVLLVSRGSPADEAWAGAARVGAEEVLTLPTDEAALVERLADAAEPDGAARVVAVLPGCGGAGGSATAAGLALVAAGKGKAAWLVDLDPLGGGADAGMGAELASGVRWSDLSGTAGRVSAQVLRDAVPSVDGVAVLACDTPDELAPAAVRTVLAAARRGGSIVVIDLPRHLTAAGEQALTAADDVIVVLPAEVRAVLAARQLLRRTMPLNPDHRVVVRRVSGGVPAEEVARALGLRLAGQLDDEPEVRAALLAGRPEGLVHGSALGELCNRLLDDSVSTGRAA
jgi:secretion/DNA translocation related CpaE-like protein